VTGTWRGARLLRPASIAVSIGAVVLLPAASWAADEPLLRAGAGEFDEAALERISRPPLGLPPVPLAAAGPPSAATIQLGRKLFLDRRLSRDGNLSCAMCHVPEQGFTSNELRTAVGTEGTSLTRNSPTLLNAAYAAPFFHDGREPDLDLQPFDVFLNPAEMAAASLGDFVATVRGLADYGPLFEAAYGGPATVARIGRALGDYVRALISGNSPFDRWYFGGESDAVSAAAKRGFRLFTGKAACARCHLLEQSYSLFTDHRFHDTGLGWEAAMVRSTSRKPIRVELAPGLFQEMDRQTLAGISEPRPPDLGRYRVTGDPEDRWRFKTPILRSLTLTAPYMHDGSLSTLREVVEFYDRGGIAHEGLDPTIRPLQLADQEIDDLVAFLETLTGDDFDELVGDARSEKIGNPGGAQGSPSTD
jgi:cytochrome c peroxidase